MKPNIELHIEQLMLNGFSRRDAFYIGRAMEQELHRLISEGGIPPNFSGELHLPSLKVSDIQLRKSFSPERIGSQIAGSVHQGFLTIQSTKYVSNNF